MRNRLISLILMSLMLFGVAPLWAQAPQPVLQPLWQGYYFNNPYLLEPVVFQRQDTSIGFDWGTGSPGANIASDNFAVRWIADTELAQGTYRFYALADDEINVLVDNKPVITTFGNPRVGQIVTGDITLDQGIHRIQVDYREFTGGAYAFFSFETLNDGAQGSLFIIPAPVAPPPPAAAQTTWTADYYNNRDLAGTPVFTRQEATPSHNWGLGSPDASLPVDNFSVRWSRYVNFAGGVQRVRVVADDGVRVYVDNNLVMDEWHISTDETFTADVNLTAGIHLVRVEFYELGGEAYLDFNMTGIVTDTPPPASPTTPDGATATINTGRLNVRSEPTVSSPVITRVSRGEVLPLLATNPAGTWVQISANGVVGWVNKRFVIVNNAGAAPTASQTPPQTSTGYNLVANPFAVNIRSGPGTRFGDIGTLPLNSPAQVVGRNSQNTWWQINYQGLVGWVSAPYTRIEPAVNPADIPVTG